MNKFILESGEIGKPPVVNGEQEPDGFAIKLTMSQKDQYVTQFSENENETTGETPGIIGEIINNI